VTEVLSRRLVYAQSIDCSNRAVRFASTNSALFPGPRRREAAGSTATRERTAAPSYLPSWDDSSEQFVWHASWLEVQPMRHAVDAVICAGGMRQVVWQFAACELHNIMQFVTVEVMGVESP
jgi:hypothetical protein